MIITGIKPKGDKRARLAISGQAMKANRVWFPTGGIKDLKNQMIGFGSEKHDDLVDAFSQLVNYFTTHYPPKSGKRKSITFRRSRQL